jgi:competence protein ComGC
MRHAPLHKSEAFTRIELILVIWVILFVFVLLLALIPATRRVTARAPRITCVNNLKQIGLAYHLWANDHHDRFPASESVTNGGWREVLANADQGFLCWTNYSIMAEELGQLPKILVCPSDERKPADTFSNLVSDTNLSYFVGVSADDNQPESLLGGDRNLGGGTKPDRGYGFSPKSGKGNDVAIQTNSQAGPICWSLKIHSLGNAAGAGNIMLADGNVQQVTSGHFRAHWQPFAGLTTNWPAGHVPSAPSIRVLFP